MYSGTTFRNGSGGFAGVHQKIDKIARRNLNKNPSKTIDFPTIKEILFFEGNNGPDSIKQMGTPTEPWHFINPADKNDVFLIGVIDDHVNNLAIALSKDDKVRSSFEAAWLAHAIVDGLTPAHHYPLGEIIEKLWQKPRTERSSKKEKNIIKGKNRRDTIARNWAYWGAGGVITTHFLFELGVATAILFTNRFKTSIPSYDEVSDLKKNQFKQIFIDSANRVYAMDMYNTFIKKGWTIRLANDAKKVLVPEIIKTVTLAWHQAIIIAEDLKKNER